MNFPVHNQGVKLARLPFLVYLKTRPSEAHQNKKGMVFFFSIQSRENPTVYFHNINGIYQHSNSDIRNPEMEIPTHFIPFEYSFYSNKSLRKKTTKRPPDSIPKKNKSINRIFIKKMQIIKRRIRFDFEVAFFSKNPRRKQENLSKRNI